MLASAAKADALGVPEERRVYLRGAAYAEDPAHVAGHPELWRSPAMAAAAGAALAGAGIGVDDVAHFDLYSCFASSVCFALDALGIAEDDGRAVTQTGGLPYHGGPGLELHDPLRWRPWSRRCAADPGSYGVMSGVGMHMQKHAYGVWSTDPGTGVRPTPSRPRPPPSRWPSSRRPRERRPWRPTRCCTVATAVPSGPCSICDLPGGGRCYALLDGGGGGAQGTEAVELVGRRVTLTPADGINHAALD